MLGTAGNCQTQLYTFIVSQICVLLLKIAHCRNAYFSNETNWLGIGKKIKEPLDLQLDKSQS
jgi:hypothetical protein